MKKTCILNVFAILALGLGSGAFAAPIISHVERWAFATVDVDGQVQDGESSFSPGPVDFNVHAELSRGWGNAEVTTSLQSFVGPDGFSYDSSMEMTASVASGDVYFAEGNAVTIFGVTYELDEPQRYEFSLERSGMNGRAFDLDLPFPHPPLGSGPALLESSGILEAGTHTFSLTDFVNVLASTSGPGQIGGEERNSATATMTLSLFPVPDVGSTLGFLSIACICLSAFQKMPHDVRLKFGVKP